MQAQAHCTMPWFYHGVVKNFKIRHLKIFQTGHLTERRLLILMKHNSDSQQIFDSKQLKC